MTLPVVCESICVSVTHEQQAKFLTVLGNTGNVVRACREAETYPMAVYRLRKSDPEFAAAWDEAHEAAGDVLEAEAVRRATEGWDEPVFYQGVATGTVRKFSDALLSLLLRGAKPEKYRDRLSADVTQRGNPALLTDDELDDKILEAAQRIQAKRGESADDV